jgi:citronellol/citronellal dehydrogenase
MNNAQASQSSVFKGKTVLITGASRGIGKEIGRLLAAEGANIVIAAKTTEPHPKLEGTIYTAAEEMEAAGGQALPLKLDIRNEEEIDGVVAEAVAHFGGIDILINNASAISLTPVVQTSPKRYDLMHQVNVRGTFLMSQACMPHLKESQHAHILNLSPPLNMQPHWFGPHLAYTMAKYGMSMCVLGLSEELKPDHISVNALWPATLIATAAIKNLLGGEKMIQVSRTPAIVAEAARAILRRPPMQDTGQFFIDEEVLKAEGVEDFSSYAVNPQLPLQKDLFL